MLKIKKVLHYVDFKNFNIMLFKKRDDHICYVFRKNDKKMEDQYVIIFLFCS